MNQFWLKGGPISVKKAKQLSTEQVHVKRT